MTKLIVEGGHPLRGNVRIQGSKNASLPILAATLLTDEPCTLHHIPDISDVHSFLDILKTLGTKVQFENNTVTLHTPQITHSEAPMDLVKQMRASILLLGPMLARHGSISMGFPGGCVLGKRPTHVHEQALESLGAQMEVTAQGLRASANKLVGNKIIMAESSVTATENALMAAVLAQGTTEIYLAAMEPHVQDLCHFLNRMGAAISGIGCPTLVIEGVDRLHGAEYEVTSDYLVTGTLALAALLTRGEVTLEGIVPHHLNSFWEKLQEAGAPLTLTESSVTLHPLQENTFFRAIDSLKTAIHPGFATDLQAPFSVLLTQAEGESRIFETLFEGRLNYLFELEKLGAKIELLNPQQAAIHGPTRLKGAAITSCDIRAGAAMILAALVAQGRTEISDIRYIDRGYERLDEILKRLGAKIWRE